jgi:hypothetical protein
MMNQDPSSTVVKPLTIFRVDEAQTTGESSEVKKELTDEELASVAAGHGHHAIIAGAGLVEQNGPGGGGQSGITRTGLPDPGSGHFHPL